MAFSDMLNLASSVTVIKTTSYNDGMGGVTTTTESSVLSRAAIWQTNSINKFLSERITKDSSHVLAIEYGTYDFNQDLATGVSQILTVTYDGDTYSQVGFADNVMNMNEIVVVGLDRKA